MWVNGEALQWYAVYKKLLFFFYYKSRENPYQVLQLTCAAIKSASERAIKIESSYGNNAQQQTSNIFPV